jgi:SAM-dependent methyltransferase
MNEIPLAMARWNPVQWRCRKPSGTITSKVLPTTDDRLRPRSSSAPWAPRLNHARGVDNHYSRCIHRRILASGEVVCTHGPSSAIPIWAHTGDLGPAPRPDSYLRHFTRSPKQWCAAYTPRNSQRGLGRCLSCALHRVCPFWRPAIGWIAVHSELLIAHDQLGVRDPTRFIGKAGMLVESKDSRVPLDHSCGVRIEQIRNDPRSLLHKSSDWHSVRTSLTRDNSRLHSDPEVSHLSLVGGGCRRVSPWAVLLGSPIQPPTPGLTAPTAYDLRVGEASDYAFPHSAEAESRRLQLLEQRLDPLTKRRIQRLGVRSGDRCLEIGGGRGSITRWLADLVGRTGRVIATDLQLGFLTKVDAPNVEVLRHDIRTDTFPPSSFDLIHTRAVLMHISPSVDLLRRIVAWLAPGGWLVLEEPDFGMWMGDADPVWATSPETTQVAFPSMALSQGRSLLRQIHQLGLTDVGADAEIDIIQAGTDLAEFYQLSQAALASPKVQAEALSLAQATALIDRPGDDDFLASGFVHIGVWGRRPGTPGTHQSESSDSPQ